MTGTCRLAGCGQIITGPESNDPTLSKEDRDWQEFSHFREVYLQHCIRYHPDITGTFHAHAADYLKTILTKNVSSSDARVDEARHDFSRLFYWMLMGDLLVTKTPHPPMMPPPPGAH